MNHHKHGNKSLFLTSKTATTSLFNFQTQPWDIMQEKNYCGVYGQGGRNKTVVRVVVILKLMTTRAYYVRGKKGFLL